MHISSNEEEDIVMSDTFTLDDHLEIVEEKLLSDGVSPEEVEEALEVEAQEFGESSDHDYSSLDDDGLLWEFIFSF